MLSQPINPVLTRKPALVTLDPKHGELTMSPKLSHPLSASQHPSRRKARFICAVVASISNRIPVWVAFDVNSAAKSQRGTRLTPRCQKADETRNILQRCRLNQGRRSVRSRGAPACPLTLYAGDKAKQGCLHRIELIRIIATAPNDIVT